MVGYDTIIPPGREGKITQEIKLGHGKTGKLRKYVTVTSNARNTPTLRLSLGCMIRDDLGITPGYISLTPDSTGKVTGELTLTTEKPDLKVSEVRFVENRHNTGNKNNWQAELPLLFTSKLTRTETIHPDGFIDYSLAISLNMTENKTLYGKFTIVTNHPKKQELTVQGTLLERPRKRN